MKPVSPEEIEEIKHEFEIHKSKGDTLLKAAYYALSSHGYVDIVKVNNNSTLFRRTDNTFICADIIDESTLPVTPVVKVKKTVHFHVELEKLV
jgi:hypothetical protein